MLSLQIQRQEHHGQVAHSGIVSCTLVLKVPVVITESNQRIPLPVLRVEEPPRTRLTAVIFLRPAGRRTTTIGKDVDSIRAR